MLIRRDLSNAVNQKLILAIFLGLFWAFTPDNAQAQNLKTLIDTRAAELEDKVIEWCRHIHENPELSNREYETAKYIAAHLEELGVRTLGHLVVDYLESAGK